MHYTTDTDSSLMDGIANYHFSDSEHINYKIENSILISTYKKDINIDLEIAKRVVQQRLSFQNGKSYLTMTDARFVKSASKEARDYLAKHDDGLIAAAILGESALSNMIINMFITFSKPKIPTKAFQEKENAIKWLSQFQLSAAPLNSKEPMYEFCKLDAIDLKVASWLFSKSPRTVYNYLQFITKNNYQRKGVILDVEKIYGELAEVHNSSSHIH